MPAFVRAAQRQEAVRRPLRTGATIFALAFAAAAAPGTTLGQAAWQVYEYDSLGNLVRSWGGDGRDARFAYDTADNRTEAQVLAGQAPPQPPMPPQPAASPQYRVLVTPGGAVVFPFPR
jgi:YD repeat-containing protein